MTWVAIARKDFEDAVRSRTLWAIGGLFVVLAVVSALLFALLSTQSSGPISASSRRNTMLNLVLFLRGPTGWLVPITALLVGYRAIAGERESGSIKLLLSLPHERRDVMFGKVVGRSLVVATAIATGFGMAMVIGLVLYPTFSPLLFLVFILATVALSTAFVGISVGFSAVTASASRAAAGVVGLFVVFNFVWSNVPNIVYLLTSGSFAPAPGSYPAWFLLLQRLTPSGAYEGTLLLFQPSTTLASKLGGPAPFYLTWWFAILILVLWAVVPAWLGYLRFREADL